MEPFKRNILVKEEDLDDLKHVNNVRYVQWIQDISKEHWNELTTESIQNQFIWVVLNHNIDYKSAAVLGDKILQQTYIESSKGPLCIRVVEMYNFETKKLLVRSKTKWCLLNPVTLKPIRISDEIRSLFKGVTKYPS
ncbi:acyl-CoA thioesterase [Eudoraea sp.]|uniref:acyl-CoA thioesterase n=1 Tax=Eudoraea sp. TaxID=1979955 RepID=UPI003C74648A